MVKSHKLDGLVFDKLVFEALTSVDAHEGSRDQGDTHLKLREGEKTLGITQGQILRAVHAIRAKGYPVVSMSTKRTREDGFKIPPSPKEYMVWRNKMVDDMKSLRDTLILCDAGARARFGADSIPAQEMLF